MSEFIQSPALLCAGVIVILSAVVYAMRGEFERRFIDYTDDAIKKEQDKIDQRNNAGREWGRRS